jgi:hypothetical protein
MAHHVPNPMIGVSGSQMAGALTALENSNSQAISPDWQSAGPYHAQDRPGAAGSLAGIIY